LEILHELFHIVEKWGISYTLDDKIREKCQIFCEICDVIDNYSDNKMAHTNFMYMFNTVLP